jgi:hypothetical protein
MGEIVHKVHKVGKFLKLRGAFYFINFLLFTFNCVAQSDSTFKYKGILRGTANFALGDMPENNITNAYLAGNLEYYPNKKISVRGDIYWFINSLSKNSPLKNNDALYYGAYYHFMPNRHFDPLLGFQPGISYTQFLAPDGTLETATICPLTSFVVGFNFYAEKWFHFQLNIRYAIGEHLTTGDETNISEISLNFGLGFNIIINSIITL